MKCWMNKFWIITVIQTPGWPRIMYSGILHGIMWRIRQQMPTCPGNVSFAKNAYYLTARAQAPLDKEAWFSELEAFPWSSSIKKALTIKRLRKYEYLNCESHSVISDSLWPQGPYSPWNSLYQLSHQRSPRILELVAYPFCSGSFQPRNWTGVSSIADGRRQWHPTPVLLPGKSHGQRSLVGCSPWGRWGSDTTERLHIHFSLSCIGEGNGNSLQCSCLENPRDRGAWWAAVYGVTQSRTRLKWHSSSSMLPIQGVLSLK